MGTHMLESVPRIVGVETSGGGVDVPNLCSLHSRG